MATETKKKTHVMNLVLIYIGIFLTLFTCVVLWMNYNLGYSSDVLTTCVFAACIGEGSAMAAIQCNKTFFS